MTTKIVRIRNSQASRTPTPILAPRSEWDKAFRGMAERGDDRLLDTEEATITAFDENSWEW